MVKSKYTFEKRQREIARKQKKEEKAARRAEAKQENVSATPGMQEEEPAIPDGASDL
jgi:hypothetical protein